MDFVGSSWELYRAELEAVTFPVFVHCYLTLVNFGHGDHVGTRSKSATCVKRQKRFVSRRRGGIREGGDGGRAGVSIAMP